MRRLAPLLLALLLAGCTSIPTSGPVETVPVTVQPRGVEIAPEPPEAGVTQARLVDGFLQAMADPEADYAVARDYLTADARDDWAPETGATIYEGLLSDVAAGVGIEGVRIGSLDAVGRFTSSHDELRVDFGLVMEDGEWRIGAPPEGVLISRYIFERYYSHVTTYFLARAGDYVIPDLIHVPEALLTPNRVVEAQIAGPSQSISRVVRNAVPLGVSLGPDPASVAPDGTARVSLTGVPDSLSEERRRELGVQLVWSLTAIPRTNGLSLTTGTGATIQLPGQNAEGVLELAAQQGYQALSQARTTDLFGVREGVGGQVTSAGAFLPIETKDLPVAEIAVSLDGTLVALVDATRRQVLTGRLGGDLSTVVPGVTELRSAQFVQGNLWLAGTDAAGAMTLLRVDGQGNTTLVSPADIPATIIDFSVSQTGARVALVVQGAGGPALGTAVVTVGEQPRLSDWTPLTLTGPTGSELLNVAAVDWSGETEVAAIAEAGGLRSVFLTRLDGSLVEDLGPVGEVPVSLAALPRLGGDALVVRSAENVVVRYEARSRWTRLDEPLEDIAYPG